MLRFIFVLVFFLLSLWFGSRVARWYISKPKIPFGYILEGLRIENVCIDILWSFEVFYNHLACFMAIWYILLSFGKISTRFGMLYQEKSGNPVREAPTLERNGSESTNDSNAGIETYIQKNVRLLQASLGMCHFSTLEHFISCRLLFISFLRLL
jgi:hypothetical protein